jgi:hypothetical protein
MLVHDDAATFDRLAVMSECCFAAARFWNFLFQLMVLKLVP